MTVVAVLLLFMFGMDGDARIVRSDLDFFWFKILQVHADTKLLVRVVNLEKSRDFRNGKQNTQYLLFLLHSRWGSNESL